MSGQGGRYQRSFPGMVGALLVLLIVVFGFVGFRSLFRSDVPDPVPPVDYADNLEFWRSEANFPLLAPSHLPAGWKATSARFVSAKPQSWHLGVLTDRGHYIGLEQQRREVAAMVSSYVDKAADRGESVPIGGEMWQSYSDSGGDQALVLRRQGVTTVVVGTVTERELADYVSSLR